MPYVFGVDGGASSCRSILVTDQGRVVHIGKGPGVNYHEIGASNVSNTISRLFQDALKAAHARPAECLGICAGLAGVGRKQDHDMLSPLFDDLFGKENYLLLSDAEIALAGGALSESGVIVQVGTGSIIYGRNEEQKTSRIGGYGPLISDDGSGYRIAIQALRALAQYHDGLGISTLLYDLILEAIKAKDFNEMVTWLYSPAASREVIASIAPLVVRAASEDDPKADEILNQEADQLALGVEALCKKLDLPDRVNVVLSGGLFSEASFFGQIVRRKIRYLLPGANVIAPILDPVLGAALYAMTIADISLDQDILDTVKRTYNETLQQPHSTSEILESSVDSQEETG